MLHWKIVCVFNTDFPYILKRHTEIKEPFPGLSKEGPALVES